MKNFLIYLIVCVFCSFYYLNDFREVKYDSEPDYISNALVIHSKFRPIKSGHPGTINYYFVAANLGIAQYFNLDLSSSIIFIRLVYLLIFFLILFYTKTDLTSVFLFFIISSLSFLNNINFIISAEILLFPLVFLLWDLINRNKSKFLIAFVFGIMLNVKITALGLLPLLLFFLNKNDYKIKNFVFYSFLTYFIFSIPVMSSLAEISAPFRNIIDQTGLITFIENTLSIDLKYTFINLLIYSFLILLTSILFLHLFFKYLNFFTSNLFYKIFCIGYLLLIIMLFNSALLRHFSPIIALIILQNTHLFNKIKFKRGIATAFTLIFLFISCYRLNNYLSLSTNSIDSFIKKSNKKVFLFQYPNFNSSTEFINWIIYGYSNSLDFLPNNWKSEIQNTEYLNLRYYMFFNYEPNRVAEVDKLLSGEVNEIAKITNTEAFSKSLISQLHEASLNNNELILDKNNSIAFEQEFLKVKNILNHEYIYVKNSYTDFYIYNFKKEFK